MRATTVEEQLSWEAERRPRMATIAIAGGLATVVGNVLLTVLTGGGPTEDDGFTSLPEAFGARLGGASPQGQSLSVRLAQYLGDRWLPLTLSSILVALGAAALAWTALFLYRCTIARTPAPGRVPFYALMVGLVAAPLGHILWQAARWIGAAGFDGSTAGAARDAINSPIVGLGTFLELLGDFALAVGVVLAALHAMRAGLLTRLLGIVGIVTGILVVFQAEPGIIRAFWLVAVGLMLGGRVSVPPAWETGRAEPWPTQQQLREQRDGAGAGGGAVVATPAAAAPEPVPAAPAAARKKRKRRR